MLLVLIIFIAIATTNASLAVPAANHLQGQVSPYLLEHAHDAVDWYPWGEAPFARAKKENKPVFLSSGFAACHWCHVMQKESFTDAATAKVLNENFVCILVDREELPAVDEAFARAVQAVGGRAGWPLTVFLTPAKKPFFAGTYFPTEPKLGLPPFTQVLRGVLKSWREKRTAVDQSALELYHSVSALNSIVVQKDKTDTVTSAGEKLVQRVDPDWGGISGDRKFAHPGALLFAVQQLGSMPKAAWRKNPLAQGYLQYLTATLDNMNNGGIHDQLRGGFFRYASDRQWRVPHFEKMLSDNALISQCYLAGADLTGNDNWKNVGLATLDFCLTHLTSPQGAFFGSIDADSGGKEGGYYTFTEGEIFLALGPADGKYFCTAYGVNGGGGEHSRGLNKIHSRDGRSVLCLPGGPELASARDESSIDKANLDAGATRLSRLRAKLLASDMMAKRPRPRIDTKIIAGWNGLMVSSLVSAYKKSGQKKYLQAAIRCQSFISKNLYAGGSLKRIFADGRAEVNGCLDDYAYQIRALLDLSEVEKNPQYAAAAVALNGYVLAHFVGPRVGFYYSPVGSEPALVRTSCARDIGMPAPAAIQVSNLLRLYRLTGNQSFLSVAQATSKIYCHDAAVDPTNYGFMLCAIDQVEKDANLSTH